MKKDTFYFSHDYYARCDDSIIPMLAKHGTLGYGAYWMLVEKIYEAGGRLAADWQTLGFDMRVDAALVESIATGFGLFFVKDGKVGSLAIDRRMLARAEKRQKAAEAGKLGGLAKAKAAENVANAKRLLSESLASKEKESKEKERTITTFAAKAPLAPETQGKPGEPATIALPAKPQARKVDYPADFERFWQAYPKRSNKVAAYREWVKLKPDVEIILAALKWQTTSKRWTDLGADGRPLAFVPDPERYIKYQRFLDEPQAYGILKPAAPKVYVNQEVEADARRVKAEQARRAALTPEQRKAEDDEIHAAAEKWRKDNM